MLLAQIIQGKRIKKPCSVKGCANRYAIRHRYPSYKDRESDFREWSWRIDRNDFIVNPRLANGAAVCGCHFTIRCVHSIHGALRKHSVPSLDLPGIGKFSVLPKPKERTRFRDENTDPGAVLRALQDHTYTKQESNGFSGRDRKGAAKRVLENNEDKHLEDNVFPGHGTATVADEREIGEIEDNEKDNVFTGHGTAAVADEREIGKLGDDEGHATAAVAGEREIEELGDDEEVNEDNVFGEREIEELVDNEEDNDFTRHSAAAVAGEREIGELEDDEEDNVFPVYSGIAVTAKGVIREHNAFPVHSGIAVTTKGVIDDEERNVFPGHSGIAVTTKGVIDDEEGNVFPGHSGTAVTAKGVIGDDEEDNVFPGHSSEVVAGKRVRGYDEGPSGVPMAAKRVLKGFEEYITFPGPSSRADAGKRVTEDEKEHNVLSKPSGVVVTAKRVINDGKELNVNLGTSGVAVAAKRVIKGFGGSSVLEYITYPEHRSIAVTGKRFTKKAKPVPDKRRVHLDISVPVKPGSSISVATPKNNGSKRKRKGILSYLGSTQELSVEDRALREEKLQLIISEAKRQLQYIQQKNNCTVKERFAIATRFRDTSRLEDSFSSLKSVLSKLILPHAKLRQPYSEAEKTMALILYNGGPKCYKLLSSMFALPSPGTLEKIFASIFLKPGINQNLFDRLEKKVDSMEDIKKYCILMFDEMSIPPHFHFNERSGIIEGLEDNGNVRRKKFADHALVLMVKGLTVPYTQPVFFSFSEGGTNYLDLKEILQTVLGKLLDCGLRPVATVCDQGTVNRRVVKALLEDTRTSCINEETEYEGGYFMVNGNMIFPLFDTHHILKSVRNNLLDKDLIFYESGIKKLASWDDLVAAYNLVPAETFKRMSGLTEKHIIREKMCKMKVASQVFSDKVSVALETLSHLSPEAFAKNPLETARVLQFFDALLASFSGTSARPKGENKYCVALSNDSPHIQLWNESLKIMSTMKYVHQKTGASIRTLVPLFNNWIFSIHGIIKLWNLLEGCNFKNLKCGYLNLEPLNFFFRTIRTYAVRIPYPTLFMTAYKSLMVCNFLLCAPSPGTNNYEADSTIPSKISDIFAQSTSSTLIPNVTSLSFVTIPDKNAQFGKICDSFCIQKSSTDPYIAGFLFKSVLKTIRRCEECKSSCVCDPYDPVNSFMNSGKLYPSKNFSLNALEIHYVVEYVLSHNCENIHLVHIIKETILKYVCFDWINCQRHKKNLSKAIVKLTVPYIIKVWVADINRKLCGTDTKYDGPDCMRKMALLHYLKSSKFRKRIYINI